MSGNNTYNYDKPRIDESKTTYITISTLPKRIRNTVLLQIKNTHKKFFYRPDQSRGVLLIPNVEQMWQITNALGAKDERERDRERERERKRERNGGEIVKKKKN